MFLSVFDVYPIPQHFHWISVFSLLDYSYRLSTSRLWSRYCCTLCSPEGLRFSQNAWIHWRYVLYIYAYICLCVDIMWMKISLSCSWIFFLSVLSWHWITFYRTLKSGYFFFLLCHFHFLIILHIRCWHKNAHGKALQYCKKRLKRIKTHEE